MAQTTVKSEQIATNAISGTIIADNAITGVHIAQNAILTQHIDDGQVGTSQLAADAVTGAKLADSSVVTANIQDDQVTGDKLANNITIAGTLASTGVLTANAGVVVDNITIDGTEIDLSSGDMTIDVAGDIILDAEGEQIRFKDAGTEIGHVDMGSSNLNIRSTVSDKDILFYGNDGGSDTLALTLDMSDAGTAIFNHDVKLPDSGEAIFGAGSDLRIYHDGSNSHIVNNYGVLYIDQDKQDGNLVLRCDDMSGGLHDYFYLDGGSGSIKGKAIKDIEWTTTATNSTAGHHIFKSYNTEIMRIDGANNRVGIGTSSPSCDLHLYNSGNTDRPELRVESVSSDNNAVNGAALISLYHNDANNSGILDNTAIGQVRFIGDDKDGGSEHVYCYMQGYMKDPGSGSSRKGRIGIHVRNGGAVDEAFTFAHDGKLGIGVVDASEKLHIKGSNAAQKIRIERREVDGAMSDGDELGAVEFWTNEDTYASGAAALRAKMMAMVENTSSGTNLQFWTGPTAGSSGIAMKIGADGGVLMGNRAQTGGQFSPTSKLVVGAGATGGTTPAASFQANTSTASGSIVVWYTGGGGEVGAVSMSNLNAGSTVTYGGTSDYRLKENVDYTWNATTRLKQLKPARFNWIADSTNTLQDGFLAHEVENIVPEAVIGQKDAVKEDDSIKPQMMDNAKLVPLLVKTIQELEARITAGGL